MNWGGWESFWAMGGYAFYVWGAYGVTAVVIAAEIRALAARRRGVLADLARRGRSTVEES